MWGDKWMIALNKCFIHIRCCRYHWYMWWCTHHLPQDHNFNACITPLFEWLLIFILKQYLICLHTTIKLSFLASTYMTITLSCRHLFRRSWISSSWGNTLITYNRYKAYILIKTNMRTNNYSIVQLKYTLNNMNISSFIL